MRNFKKVIALVLALALTMSTFTVAFAAEKTSADKLSDLGLLLNTTEEELGAELTRDVGLAMILKALGWDQDAANEKAAGNPFTDVTQNWFKGYAGLAVELEITTGKSATSFAPKDVLTQKEFVAFMLRALGYESAKAWDEAAALGAAAGLVEAGNELDAASFVKADAADVMLKALMADMQGEGVTGTLADALIAEGHFTLEAAIAAGVKAAIPAKLEVVSVKADNLKQVVVTFNQEVNEDTATNVKNYSIDGVIIDANEITLSEDGKVATLTLLETDAFTNQKEYEINIDTVESKDGKLNINDLDVKFTPVDSTIPSVKEVVALGTKALKIVFSEPVQRASAATTSAYKIDDKSISGSVKYVYPNAVIITTTMTTGDHTLAVSSVKDFYDFSVNQKDVAFTVAEDTEAPVIVSAKTIDLKKAEIIFNEPVKAVVKAYHGSTSNPATVVIKDNKVTLTFTNNMSLGNTTIFLEGVEDYSGNKATRNIVVVPELDMTRPEVKRVEVELVGGNHEITAIFNKEVNETSAETRTNYVLKDKDGKVVTGKGLNSKGEPVVAPVYTNADKEVTFKLNGKLDAGTYTLEIAGIKDNAYVSNIMLPYSTTFEVGDTKAPTLSAAWLDQRPVTGTAKFDAEVYIQFSEAMAISGNGNALDLNKYNYATVLNGPLIPFPTKSTIEMIGTDTVKITLPRADVAYNIAQARVTLVTDVAENYLGGTTLQGLVPVTVGAVSVNITSATATDVDTIEVVFGGILTNVDATDFLAGTKAVTLDSFSVEDGETTAIFKLAKADELLASVGVVAFTAKAAPHVISSQTGFGAKVANSTFKNIADEIRATALEDYDSNDVNGKQPFKVAAGGTGDYQINVKFDEAITAFDVKDIVSVKVNGTAVVVDKVAASTNDLVVDFSAVKLSDGTTAVTVNSNSIIEITLKDANDAAKIVTDAAVNAVNAFNLSSVLSDVAATALSEAWAVADAKAALTLAVTNPTAATATITLPATQGVATVTWAVEAAGDDADDDGAIAAGVYTSPARIATASSDVLTATITVGGTSTTQTFTVTIPAGLGGTGAITVVK